MMHVLRLFLVLVLGVGAWAVDATASFLTPNATYTTVGNAITIHVVFTGPVNIDTTTSKMKLNLHRLADDAYAVATAPATAVTAANFTYYVQAGDYSTNLTYTDAAALTGVSGYAGALTGTLSGILINTPLLVQSVTSSPATGSRKLGDTVTITTSFNRFATASGFTPNLTLVTGVNAVTVVNGSTATGSVSGLNFTYTVKTGNTSADLDYLNSSALSLGGGNLDDTPSLTLPVPGATNSLGATSSLVIDGVAPIFAISKPTTAQKTAPITYTIDAQESVSGFTSVNVTNCTATLTATPTGSGRYYTSLLTPTSRIELSAAANAGATSLAVNSTTGLYVGDPVVIGGVIYTIASVPSGSLLILSSGLTASKPFHTDIFPPTGIAVGINIPAGAAFDTAGNGSVIVTDQTVVYDPTPPLPKIATPTAVSPTSIAFTVTFTEPADTVLENSGMTVTNGVIARIDGTANPVFVVTVTPIDSALPVILNLLAGAVKDAATNPSLAATQTYTPASDTTAPTITAATSTNANGSYKAGQTLTINLTTSEVVVVTGTPKLVLNSGGSADFTSGSGTTTLTFSYVVGLADTAADLDITSINLNGGTVKDAADNPATFTVASLLSTSKNLRIVVPPTVMSIQGLPLTGSYAPAHAVVLTVTLNRPAAIAGSGATLQLETGATKRNATLTTVMPATTDTLTFSYAVQTGDVSADLDYTSTTALSLNSITMDGLSGLTLSLAAPGATGSLGKTSDIVIVDTPVTLLAIVDQVGIANTPPVAVTITANQAVTGFVNADLTTTNTLSATIAPIAGGNDFTATLTPQSTLFMNAVQPNAQQLILRARGLTAIPLITDQAIKIGTNIGVIASDVQVSTTADTLVTLKDPLPLGLATGIDVWQPTGVAMTLAIKIDAVQDSAGENSAAVTAKTFTYDPMAPIATILVPGTSASPYLFTVQFNETVSAPLAAAFTATGGTVTTVTNSVPGATWTVTVIPTVAGGTVGLTLNANAVRDLAQNANLASATTTFIPLMVTKIEASPTTATSYHPGDVVTLIATLNHSAAFAAATTAPTLALRTSSTTIGLAHLTSPSTTTASSTLTFQYTVLAGDSAGDLDITAATALDLLGHSLSGITTLSVPAPGTTGSLANTSAVTLDSTPPTVTLSGAPVTGKNPAELTISFNEAINPSTLTLATVTTDFTLPSGVTAHAVTLNSANTAAVVSFDLAEANIAYTISVKPGAVTDVAGNSSTDTPSITVTYNSAAPVLTLTAPTIDQKTAPFAVTISASKSVTGLTTSDCNVTNGTASGLSGSGTAYSVDLMPTASMTLALAATVGVSTIRLQGDDTLAARAVLRIGNSVVRLSTTAATTVTNAGIVVNLESALSAAIPLNTPVWKATGVLLSISVPVNACVDDNLHANAVASLPVQVRYDPTPPMFVVEAIGFISTGELVYTVTPSEPVSGLTLAGLEVTNGVALEIDESIDRLTWTAYIRPTSTESIALGVKASAAIDSAGNPSLAEAALPLIILPRVTKLACDNKNGTYGPGIHLRVRVTFNETVHVVGVPTLLLNLTASGREALYTSGSEAKELLFDYTTVAGDATTDLDYLSTTALKLPTGASIVDDSGNAAILTLGKPGGPRSLAANADIVVSDDSKDRGKPDLLDQPTASSGGCGAGSGIALILAGGWLGLGLTRRRRAA